MADDARKRTHEGSPVTATDNPTVQVLSKCSDAILYVGKEPECERKLLVSSALLSHALPVFAVMFDGCFAEGQALSPASPQLILLPGDDTIALTTVCKIIHLQTTNISMTAAPTELADIAIICHKYDCVNVVRAWSVLWVNNITRNPVRADHEKTLVAAYLLGMEQEFRAVSQRLIRIHLEHVSPSAFSNGYDYTPLQLLDCIVKEQHDRQKRATDALASIIPTKSKYQAAPMAIELFFKDRRKAEIWLLGMLFIHRLTTKFAEITVNRSDVHCC